MRILVFGSSGQVATELAHRAVAPVEIITMGRNSADFGDPGACVTALKSVAPDAVINAAAYTAVDRAEDDAALAHVINGQTPGALAHAAAGMGIPFVHISTDYVFDGTGTAPFAPDHATAPLGVYGHSKLAGETALRAAGGIYAILRVSWVFSAHGSNFVKTMLRLGGERDRLSIVADQIGGPTPAAAIADACITMARTLIARPDLSGIYHLSGVPDTSWAGFARAIFAESGQICDVVDIATPDYPTPAARPLNSRLDCSGLQGAFGITRPDWRAALRAVVSELKGTAQ